MDLDFLLAAAPGRIPEIAGQPLTIYAGFLVLAVALATALVGYLYHRRIMKIPVKQHKNMAFITLGVAVFHGILAAIDRFFPP